MMRLRNYKTEKLQISPLHHATGLNMLEFSRKLHHSFTINVGLAIIFLKSSLGFSQQRDAFCNSE